MRKGGAGGGDVGNGLLPRAVGVGGDGGDEGSSNVLGESRGRTWGRCALDGADLERGGASCRRGGGVVGRRASSSTPHSVGKVPGVMVRRCASLAGNCMELPRGLLGEKGPVDSSKASSTSLVRSSDGRLALLTDWDTRAAMLSPLANAAAAFAA